MVADMIMKRMKEKTTISIITPQQPVGDETFGDEDGVDGSRPANKVVKSPREKSTRMTQVAGTGVGEEVEVGEEDEGVVVAGAEEEGIDMRAEVIKDWEWWTIKIERSIWILLYKFVSSLSGWQDI